MNSANTDAKYPPILSIMNSSRYSGQREYIPVRRGRAFYERHGVSEKCLPREHNMGRKLHWLDIIFFRQHLCRGLFGFSYSPVAIIDEPLIVAVDDNALFGARWSQSIKCGEAWPLALVFFFFFCDAEKTLLFCLHFSTAFPSPPQQMRTPQSARTTLCRLVSSSGSTWAVMTQVVNRYQDVGSPY